MRILRKKILKNARVLKHGSIAFVAHHEILIQLSTELITGLPESFKTKHNKVVIYCGAHREMGVTWFKPGYKVAIQTEQFFDEAGTSLWGIDRKKGKKTTAQNVITAIKRCNIFLDLSEANKPFYEALDLSKKLKKKIQFGPHIFPDKEIAFKEGQNKKIAFFGSLRKAERRAEVIQNIAHFEVDLIEEGTYGAALHDRIKTSDGILNIHFQEGVYTEAPRLLTALLCGKVVISEKLAAPFQGGLHYLDIDGYDADQAKTVFENFSLYTSQNYSFRKFLSEHSV